MAGFGDERFLFRGPTGLQNLGTVGSAGDGTYQGLTSVVADTGFGGVSAFSFSGTNTGILCGQTSGVGNGDYTVAAWIKDTAPIATATQVIVGQRVGSKYPFMLTVNDGEAGNLSLLTFDGTTLRAAFSGVSATLDNWFFVVGVHSGTSIKIYVNGTLRSTTSVAGRPDWSNTDKLTIGYREQSGSNLRFSGLIDDVRVFSREITAAEISAWNTGGRGYDVAPLSSPRRRRRTSGGVL